MLQPAHNVLYMPFSNRRIECAGFICDLEQFFYKLLFIYYINVNRFLNHLNSQNPDIKFITYVNNCKSSFKQKFEFVLYTY